MKKRISIVLVFVLGLIMEVSKADFFFGPCTNLGPPFEGYDPQGCCFSRDGLELYFSSNRPGGMGLNDLWVVKRETIGAPWGEPVNLGSNVNTPSEEFTPAISPDGLELYFRKVPNYIILVCTRPTKDTPWSNPESLAPQIGNDAYCPEVSADGLSLYFGSRRTDGYGDADIWVSNRAATSDPWSEPINLGPIVNTDHFDSYPSISSNGLVLFFASNRPGGYGDIDIWVTTRSTIEAEWGPPVSYPYLNSERQDFDPAISPDDSVLYFESPSARWQSSINPIVDLNGDGIVDVEDMCVTVNYWGEYYPLCDIGPTPLGDGVVDVQDLIVLSEHLFEKVNDPTLIAHWALDETEGMFAADSAGDNDAVVLGGIEWQPAAGQIDGALKLDGVSGYAVTSAVLNPTDGPFSILAWINGGAPGQVIVSQQNASNWLATDAEGNLMTELKGAGRSTGPLFSEAVITDGQWHRIGLIWDGSNRTLCVNGVIVAEDTQPDLESSENGLNIGAGNKTQSGTYFSGLFDDIRIYNRAVRP